MATDGERRESTQLIMDSLNRIDSRTEGMDNRLRNVEAKLYNGINDRMDRFEERLSHVETVSASSSTAIGNVQAVKQHNKETLFKWLRILGGIGAVVGLLVAIGVI